MNTHVTHSPESLPAIRMPSLEEDDKTIIKSRLSRLPNPITSNVTFRTPPRNLKRGHVSNSPKTMQPDASHRPQHQSPPTRTNHVLPRLEVKSGLEASFLHVEMGCRERESCLKFEEEIRYGGRLVRGLFVVVLWRTVRGERMKR